MSGANSRTTIIPDDILPKKPMQLYYKKLNKVRDTILT